MTVFQELIKRVREFLGWEKLIALSYDYQNRKGCNVSDLLTEYGITEAFSVDEVRIIISTLYKILPPIETSIRCKYCNEFLLQTVSRDASRPHKYYCPKCGHNGEDNPQNCSCQNCKETIRKQNIQNVIDKYQENIEEFFFRFEFSKEDNSNSTLEIAVLYALNKSIKQKEEYYNNDNNCLILPTFDNARIIEHLCNVGLITVKKEKIIAEINELFEKLSSLDSDHLYSRAPSYLTSYINEKLSAYFIFNKDKSIAGLSQLDAFTFNYSLVNDELNDLISLRKIPAEQLVKIWKELAVNECIEQFRYRMNLLVGNNNRTFSSVEKLFSQAINFLSARRICSLLWSSYNHASGIKLERQYVSSIHLANIFCNIVIRNINQHIEQCKLNNTTEDGKGVRERNCPYHLFNKIFYEDILQLGEDGFNLVPCKENLTIHDIFNDKLSEIYRDLEQD